MVDPELPTSVDVPEFPPDEVRAGDLVFFTFGADQAAHALAAVDGVILAHVGVALGDGTVVSCRADGSGPLDLPAGGGVRRDELDWWREEMGRQAFVGRVGPADLAPDIAAAAEVRDRAAAAARRHLEHPTALSATKSVLWVLAIGTMPLFPFFPPEIGDVLVDLAVATADEWRAGAEYPVYANAEFVAAVFGTRFTRAHLQHKSVIFHEQGYVEPTPRWADLVDPVLAEQPGGRKTVLLSHLARGVRRWEPVFMPDIVGALAAPDDPRWGPPVTLPKATHRPVPHGERLVPAALTTPRMLAEASFVGDVLPLAR